MCICVQAGGCLLYFVLMVIMMSYLSNIIGGVNLLEREREREREMVGMITYPMTL